MVLSVCPMYRYLIDASDAIVWVDGWWLAFARENGAASLTETSVVGRPIWDFIDGAPTQDLYRELHQRVRDQGRSIALPFRCDSPTLQRHMELTIHREAEQRLLYESRLIRAEPQRRMPVLDPGTKRSGDSLTMCSCCKRSLLEPAQWLELNDISLRLRMFDRQTVPRLDYTVCPECARRSTSDT